MQTKGREHAFLCEISPFKNHSTENSAVFSI